MRSYYTQLVLAAIAASITARKITRSETREISVEDDQSIPGIVYVGCDTGVGMTDCTTGGSDTTIQCDPATDASCLASPTEQEDPIPNLANDRSKLEGLEPGVCESMIVEENDVWT